MEQPIIQEFIENPNPSHALIVAAYVARDEQGGLGKDALKNVRNKLLQPFAGILDWHLLEYAENCDRFNFYNSLTKEQLIYAGW